MKKLFDDTSISPKTKPDKTIVLKIRTQSFDDLKDKTNS